MVEELLSAISTVGFPIAACIAMFWKVNDQDRQHKEEMDLIRESLDNNTKAITELIGKINN